MSHSYLVVEGPHDIEVIGRVLRNYGFVKIEQMSELDSFWYDLIPKSYPPGGNLLKRVPVPIFFQVSIQDNEWISSKTMDVPAVIALHQFLTNLLHL